MVAVTHTPLQQLADFAANTRLADVPASVVERAGWVLRDTVGVIVGGLAVPEVRALARYATAQRPGAARLLGTGGQTQPEWAALVYGTAGTTLEYDEGHAFARGHAAIHAVGAGLALADADDISGADLLAAVVVGYEVAARVGVAAQLREAVHPFGAWGVLGAATVAARLAGLDANALREVLELAASYAVAPSFKTAYTGASVRNTYAGMVNHNGLLALAMYRAGFRGEAGGVPTTFGEILGTGFDTGALTDGLGERYEITRGYFKPYSACRYSHAAIDAVLALRDQVDPAAVEAVTVETYATAARLHTPDPATPLAARFSIPYIVAATLIDGNADERSFTDTAIQREAVLALARRVRVVADPRYTAMAPATRAARVTVVAGGTAVTAEALGSKGDPDQPLSGVELRQKYDSLTAALSPAHRAALWQQLGDMARLRSTKALFDPAL